MKIVSHPSYTRRKVALALGVMGGAFAGPLALAATHPSIGPYLWLIVLAAAAASLSVAFPIARRSLQGDLGERRALSALRVLPDDYTAITNFVVPEARRGDIDLLVIGPPGLVAIEVKAYTGVIAYLQGTWWRVRPDGRKRGLPPVSSQARGHLQSVTGYLGRVRAGYSPLADLFVPVHVVLVFTHAARLNIVQLDIAALQVGDLAAYISGLPRRLDKKDITALSILLRNQAPTVGAT